MKRLEVFAIESDDLARLDTIITARAGRSLDALAQAQARQRAHRRLARWAAAIVLLLILFASLLRTALIR